jgi:hypothetical protein
MDVTIGVAVRDEGRERERTINCLTALIALKTWVFL